MWEALLEMREVAGEWLNCGDEEPNTVFIDDDATIEECANAYNMVKDFILSCARWELRKAAAQGELAKQHVQEVVRKYIAEQKQFLHSYFRTYMRDVNKLIPLAEKEQDGEETIFHTQNIEKIKYNTRRMKNGKERRI